MAAKRRLVVISLSRDEYELLAERARANERDPYQEARWIVTRALPGGDAPGAVPVDETLEANDAAIAS
jgi:hypothetical protein